MGHCKHFVARKKRFCKMSVKMGEEYCGEHQKLEDQKTGPLQLDTETSPKLRIVCPLDTKHTCYAHNLKKHLKICNARPIPPEPYITKGVNYNSGIIEGIIENDNNCVKLLSEFSTEQIKSTIDKISKIYDSSSMEESITENISTHALLEVEMSKPEHGHEYGNKTKKHLKQVSSILGLLNDYRLLTADNSCYIDFGAGRGQLSFWLCKATETAENSKVLLIERASPKHKRDNKITKSTEKVKRLRADISDLVLDKVQVLSQAVNIVGVAKHLCGEATDLALRCLTSTVINKEKIKGGIITFCCHHRCRWVPYIGKEFFQRNGLDNVDFNLMCGMASWATCGTGFSREKNEKLKMAENLVENDRDTQLDLSRGEKAEIGKRCKNLINWGRLDYLQSAGFKCKLHYYVDKEITLENVCIVMYT